MEEDCLGMGYPQEVAAPPQATAHHQRLAAQDYLDMVVVVEAQGDLLLLDLIMEHLRLLQYQVMVAQVQVQSALAIQLHQGVTLPPQVMELLQVVAQHPQAIQLHQGVTLPPQAMELLQVVAQHP